MNKPNTSKMVTRIMLGIPLIALIAGIGLSFFSDKPPPRPQLSESVFHFPATRNMPKFELTAHNGEAFTPESLRGKWSFLFFGYSHCPDICPTTLHDMGQVIDKLGEDSAKTQFVFVTVDPERDTVERLAKYVPFFNQQLVGVSGEPDNLAAFAKAMWVPYLKVENPDSPENYAMDHSASVLVIDPHGRFHAMISPPYTQDGLVDDWQKMAAYFDATH